MRAPLHKHHFIQHARTSVSCETAISNWQFNFFRTFFANLPSQNPTLVTKQHKSDIKLGDFRERSVMIEGDNATGRL